MISAAEVSEKVAGICAFDWIVPDRPNSSRPLIGLAEADVRLAIAQAT